MVQLVNKLKIEALFDSCYNKELDGYLIPECISEEILRLMKDPEYVYDVWGNIITEVPNGRNTNLLHRR